MTFLYEGQVVRVFSPKSSFIGERGVVTSLVPLMVLLEGERLPMCFSTNEVVLDDDEQAHVAGAE